MCSEMCIIDSSKPREFPPLLWVLRETSLNGAAFRVFCLAISRWATRLANPTIGRPNAPHSNRLCHYSKVPLIRKPLSNPRRFGLKTHPGKKSFRMLPSCQPRRSRKGEQPSTRSRRLAKACGTVPNSRSSDHLAREQLGRRNNFARYASIAVKSSGNPLLRAQFSVQPTTISVRVNNDPPIYSEFSKCVLMAFRPDNVIPPLMSRTFGNEFSP